MIPNFSDIVPDKPQLAGRKVSMDEILNIPIMVTGWAFSKSKHTEGDCLMLQFTRQDEDTGEQYVLFTGSSVLIDQIHCFEQAGAGKAFLATITRRGKCYRFGK